MEILADRGTAQKILPLAEQFKAVEQHDTGSTSKGRGSKSKQVIHVYT
jgi:hypothetical protein